MGVDAVNDLAHKAWIYRDTSRLGRVHARRGLRVALRVCTGWHLHVTRWWITGLLVAWLWIVTLRGRQMLQGRLLHWCLGVAWCGHRVTLLWVPYWLWIHLGHVGASVGRLHATLHQLLGCELRRCLGC